MTNFQTPSFYCICTILKRSVRGQRFCLTHGIKLNFTHYFIMRVPNKHKLQKVVFNQSSDIGFDQFKKIYKKCTKMNHPF